MRRARRLVACLSGSLAGSIAAGCINSPRSKSATRTSLSWLLPRSGAYRLCTLKTDKVSENYISTQGDFCIIVTSIDTCVMIVSIDVHDLDKWFLFCFPDYPLLPLLCGGLFNRLVTAFLCVPFLYVTRRHGDSQEWRVFTMEILTKHHLIGVQQHFPFCVPL